MDINKILQILNKEYGYEIDGEYYNQISEWQDWWRGFYEPFHQFYEPPAKGVPCRKRKLYTLKMAKKVCEDWAAILLNEKTTLQIDDTACSDFVQGDDGTGGVFGENDFWTQGNALVEKAFYSGTGAFVLKVNNAAIDEKSGKFIKSPDARISIDFLSAQYTIPLTVKRGHIIDAAFASESMTNGKKHVYLEVHRLIENEYQIDNRYYTNNKGVLTETNLPKGIIPHINTGSDIPWFHIIQPNAVNNCANSNGLGMAIYANAIDNLMGVDLVYNNFNREFKLGGKKVFYNRSLIDYDREGRAITPDDVAQQLFMQVDGDDDLAKNSLIHEFNPQLRVEENMQALQEQLNYLSFKCGMGSHYYRFWDGQVVTATQYTGNKQELLQHANKHYIIIERALQGLVKSILYIGREFCGMPLDETAPVTVVFEDGVIINKDAERERDRQDVRDNLMQKWEYRVKWYGEDEQTAKSMTDDKTPEDIMFGARY